MLTDKELAVKQIMFDGFIPALNHILESKNPEEYKRWGKNCCRQSAIYGAYFLKELLPQYEWSVWDGIFDDVLNGRKVHYNHAWIYGFDRENKKRLFIDLSRIYTERLFIEVNSNKYPKDHPEYSNMIEESRQQLDWQKMLNDDNEYYTHYTGEEMLNELKKLIKYDSLLNVLNNFCVKGY